MTGIEFPGKTLILLIINILRVTTEENTSVAGGDTAILDTFDASAT